MVRMIESLKFAAIILIATTLKKINCDTIRLSSLTCEDDFQGRLPIWKTPDRETRISEICRLNLLLHGSVNQESEAIHEANDRSDLGDYRLLPILSPRPEFDWAKRADIHMLPEISISSKNETSTGDISLDLSSVVLPAVEFCGYIYFILSLQKTNRLMVTSVGTLYREIEVICPRETDARIELQLYFSNGTVFNPSRGPIIIQANGVVLPKDLDLLVVNKGQSSFRRRCGLKALQITAFLVPEIRNISMDIVNISGHEMFNFLNGYQIIPASQMILEPHGYCSPFIQANSSLTLNKTLLSVDSKILPAEISELVMVLNPMGLDDGVASMETNLFRFPVKFHGTRAKKSLDRCLAIQAYPSSELALIVQTFENNLKINFYGYEITNKKLYMRKDEDSLILANKMFYQNWLINRTVQHLKLIKSCPRSVYNPSICDNLKTLLKDLVVILEQIKVTTEWEEEQMAKLSLSLRVTRQLIEEVINGQLESLFSQVVLYIRSLIVQSLASPEKMHQYDESFFEAFQRVIEDIIESEPPVMEASLLVPKRIRLFLGRLVREGVQEVIKTLPNLAAKADFLEDFRQLILWTVEDVYWDFELPYELKVKLSETLNAASPEKFLMEMTELLNLTEKWSKIDVGEEIVLLSVKLFHSVLIKTTQENVWMRLVDIWKSWSNDFMGSPQLWIFMEGMPGDSPSQNDECSQYAHEILIERSLQPKWLETDAINQVLEREETLSHLVKLKSYNESIFRGDRDILTGRTFWTRIMICTCSKALVNQCTL